MPGNAAETCTAAARSALPKSTLPKSTLLVFTRVPAPGRVKRRLVPALGAAGAAALYRSMVKRTLAVARGSGLSRVILCYYGKAPGPWLRACASNRRIPLRRQQGDDLGTRMHSALSAALAGGGAALLVGCDCPTLTAADLAAAAEKLHQGYDAALGPCTDGGYYLVGLRRPQPRLFHGIPWGGPRVMARTLERCREQGLRYWLAPQRRDLDRPADLRRLRAGSLRPPRLPRKNRRAHASFFPSFPP